MLRKDTFPLRRTWRQVLPQTSYAADLRSKAEMLIAMTLPSLLGVSPQITQWRWPFQIQGHRPLIERLDLWMVWNLGSKCSQGTQRCFGAVNTRRELFRAGKVGTARADCVEGALGGLPPLCAIGSLRIIHVHDVAWGESRELAGGSDAWWRIRLAGERPADYCLTEQIENNDRDGVVPCRGRWLCCP